MQERKELLKPKIDVVFHSLFKKGNEEITKAIISSITEEKIKEIELDKDRHIIGKHIEEKIGILDFKAILDGGTICNIEIQLANNKDTAERFLYYWSRIYSSQLLKGEDYENIHKVIGIIILDYKFEKTKEIKRMHTKWKIKETLSGKEIELTDVLELHIIEIPKVRETIKKEPENILAQWITFLDNPNQKEVLRIVKENTQIKKAMDELEEISNDEYLREIAQLREKGIKDEKNGLRHARQEGEKKKQLEIANKMLKINMPIETIMELTELTREEIEKIKQC